MFPGSLSHRVTWRCNCREIWCTREFLSSRMSVPNERALISSPAKWNLSWACLSKDSSAVTSLLYMSRNKVSFEISNRARPWSLALRFSAIISLTSMWITIPPVGWRIPHRRNLSISSSFIMKESEYPLAMRKFPILRYWPTTASSPCKCGSPSCSLCQYISILSLAFLWRLHGSSTMRIPTIQGKWFRNQPGLSGRRASHWGPQVARFAWIHVIFSCRFLLWSSSNFWSIFWSM